MPCFDDPIFKAAFDVEVTVPKGNLVFANSPEKSRTANADKTTFVFDTTKPLPTYVLALAIGPLEVVEGSKTPVPIRVITTPGHAHLAAPALRIAEEHLAVLNDYFLSPYPYPKLDIVAVPSFAAGA